MAEKKYDIRFGLHNLDCGVFLGYRFEKLWKHKKDCFRYYSEEDVGLEKSVVKDFLGLTNNHPKLSKIEQSFLITAERVNRVGKSIKEILAVYLISKNEKGFYEAFDFTEDF